MASIVATGHHSSAFDDSVTHTNYSLLKSGKVQATFSESDRVCFDLHNILGVEEKRALIVASRGIVQGSIPYETTIIDLVPRIRNCLTDQTNSYTFLYHVTKELLHSLGKPELEIQLRDIFRPIEADIDYSYQLRKHHPEVDYRLVVLEFLYKLNPGDYAAVTAVICYKLRVNRDQFDRRCDLADELFNQRFLPADLSTSGITSIYKISISFNHDHIFTDLCQRHDKPEPDVDRRLITVIQRDELLEQVFTIINVPHKKRCPCPSRKQLCSLCVIISVVVVLLIVGGVLSNYFTDPSLSSSGSSNISAQSVVNINENGFGPNLGTIDLSLTSVPSGDVHVDVYKTDCSQVTNSTTEISSKHYNSHIKFFNRQRFNKAGNNDPYIGIKGSYIIFHVFAVLMNNHSSSCLSRVRVFNNFDKFQEALMKDGDREVKGTYADSGCLSPNDTWTYTFNSSQSLYATLDVDAYVNATRYVTGELFNYDTNSLTPLPCSSSLQNEDFGHHCTIDVCGDLLCTSGSPSSTQCILINNKSNTPLQLLFETYWPRLSMPFFVTVSVFGFLSIIIPIVAVIICCCCLQMQYCKRRPRQAIQGGAGRISYHQVPNIDGKEDFMKTV